MKRILWITIALLLLLGIVLTACATPTAEVITIIETVEKIVEKEGEMVTVVETVETIVTATPEPTVSPYDDNAPIKVMADPVRFTAIEAFLDANPEYEDKVEVMTDQRGVFMTKLLLYNNVGDGWPDVIFHETASLRTANTAQYDFYTADLSLWIDQDLLDEFYPGANADCTARDGKLICLRNDIAPNIFYYNVPKFEEFGYTVPTTWEEYIALAEQVAEEHPGHIMGSLDGWATSRVWYIGSECPMMNPISLTKIRVNFLDPNCQRVSKMLDDLNALGVLDKSGTFSAGLADKVKAGQLLTWIGPVWQADFLLPGWLDAEDPANEGVIGMAPIPRWENQEDVWTASVGGGGWAMSRHTANPELAIKLITFVTTDPSVTVGAVTLAGHKAGGDGWAQALAGRLPFLAKDPDPYDAISFMAGRIWPEFQIGPPQPGTVAGPYFTEVQAGNRTAVDIAEDLQADLVDLVEKAGYEVEETSP